MWHAPRVVAVVAVGVVVTVEADALKRALTPSASTASSGTKVAAKHAANPRCHAITALALTTPSYAQKAQEDRSATNSLTGL